MLGIETPVIPSAAVNFQDAGRGDGVFFDPFGYGFSPHYLFDGGFVYGYGRRGYRGEYWDDRPASTVSALTYPVAAALSSRVAAASMAVVRVVAFHGGGGGGGYR
jgi:hypothetical protein